MRPFLSAVVLGLLAGPTVACINDSDLPRREREFRSQYRIDAPPTEPTYRPGVVVSPGAVAATGGLLLFGAVLVGSWPARSR